MGVKAQQAMMRILKSPSTMDKKSHLEERAMVRQGRKELEKWLDKFQMEKG
jgi:hypothetical protein